MSSTNTVSTSDWITALRESQQRIAALVDPMSDAEVESPSYATEWSIAQVMSHLGSGAEIFMLFLLAGIDEAPAPGIEVFQPIWADWNAKSPHDQAHDGLRADAGFVERLDAMSDDERESWQLEMFGGLQTLADLLRLRLGEHTVHTWDIAVMGDPGATLDPDAVPLLIDHMGQLVGRACKVPPEPVDVLFRTEAPSRSFRLQLSADGAALTSGDDGPAAEGEATVRLPAEALIRLFYGRLDPEHTPSVDVDGIDLATLRQMFPGV
jgi:uncharacterized protein (TIGR03083 family)